ncbi:UNVERIFIED_ORG: hypothetical protein GGD51_000316 [Rhizobium esperanzae]|nr:hypothetical protein AMC89_PD00076 [Rhizobium phaseoli]ANM01246.1 hypothetical protein AMC79_PD00076 [Rhizobium phaseoli]
METRQLTGGFCVAPLDRLDHLLVLIRGQLELVLHARRIRMLVEFERSGARSDWEKYNVMWKQSGLSFVTRRSAQACSCRAAAETGAKSWKQQRSGRFSSAH